MMSQAIVALSAMTLVGAVACAEGYNPRVGQPHPELTLPSLSDGSPVSLSQFRGRKVLLIHFASW